jgi:hypothetical protein
MRFLKTLVPVLSLILILACNLFNPEPDYMITDDDEYELFNLMIRSYASDMSFFHVYTDIGRSLAIQHPDSTYDHPTPATRLGYFGSPYDSLIAIDYLSRNDTTHYLDETRIDSPAVGITHSEFLSYFTRDSLPRGYEAYYEDYPSSGGIVYFSRPGFDPEHTRAVMSYGHSYGMLGGMGGKAVFEKIDGKWKLVGTISFWVS